MKVLHAIPNMSGGGSELQLGYLAAAQRRLGDEVHVCLTAGGLHLARLQEAGVEVHLLSTRGNHDPFLLPKMAQLVARLRPDVLQTWLRQMDVVGGLASRWTGVPWVLSERASEPAYPRGVKHGLRAWLARRASAIVSNSYTGDAYWAPRVGSDVRRRVIPNAIPLEEIAAAEPASDDVLSLPEGHKMLLFVGRFTAQKNAENLILAISLLAPALPVIVYFCGEGPDEAKLRRLAKAKGLEQTVRFVGYVSSIWSWMKRADALVQVSHFEGQPNAALEAIACDRPVVFSDIPEHRELLGDGEALFVDATSPDSIAQGLAQCLTRPEEAAQRARAARRCLEDRSPDAVAAMYRAVYEEILGNAGNRSKERLTPCAG